MKQLRLSLGLALGGTACSLQWLYAAPALLPASSPTPVPPLSSTALPGLGPEEEIAAADTARVSGNLPAAEQGYRKVLAEFDDPAADPDTAPRREGLLALLASVQIAQREYDAALPNLSRYVAAYPQGGSFEELLFWKGFVEFKLGRPEAEATLRDFVKRFPQGTRIFEARRSLGELWRQQKKYKEAADLFAALAQDDDPHRAEEARLLELSTRTEMGDEAGAGDLAARVLAADPDFTQTDRAVAFDLLAFRVGAALLDHGQAHPALAILRRLALWPRDRLIVMQQTRRAALPDDPSFQPLRAAIDADLQELGTVPDYDGALRLRAARAYLTLGRSREAALLLAETLPSWPEGPSRLPAAVTLAEAYRDLSRWDDLVTAATSVETGLADPLPPAAVELELLHAEANQQQGNLPAAIALLQRLRHDAPKDAEADRAAFLLGYDQMLAGRTADALDPLASYETDFPQSPLREDALYWKGMALAALQKPDEARTAWARQLELFPVGRLHADAAFQKARSLVVHGKDPDGKAVPALESFLHDFPSGPHLAEGRLLLADCRLATGNIDQGLTLLAQLAPTDGPLYDRAALRIGAVYESRGDGAKAEAQYRAFIENRTGAGVAAALTRIAAIERRNGREEGARTVYWDAIGRCGNDPGPEGDALFTGLLALERDSGDDGKSLANRLDALSLDAQAQGKIPLAIRAAWAESKAWAPLDPAHAREVLLRAAALANAETASGTIRADCAEGEREAGHADEARQAYQDLLVSGIETGRAQAGLGLLAWKEGKNDEALADFAQAQDAGAALTPATRAEILDARAGLLLAAGRTAEAIAEWEKLLKVPGIGGERAARTLTQLGDAYLKAGDPGKAVPCYQRVYLMYGRWPDCVARAYWQSGQAFEQLTRRDEAVATYRELVGRPDLATFDETGKARQRLAELGAVATPPPPTPAKTNL